MRKDRLMAIALSVAFGLGMIVVGGNAYAASGEKVFNTCKGCHTIKKGGRNKFGPNLFGAFGRQAGTAKGYKYRGLKGADWKWNETSLNAWLTNPTKFIKSKGRKRTAMSKRVRKAADRKAVIGYLKKMR
ncbi:MAG TPA: c-type cytochrome [Alphaproteobacteria bacterium]|nr:c-type cytochrome [Alphaproteobacteria bacterium]